MNPTKIEWTDYTWNPITGCTNNCFAGCYAKRMAQRLRGRHGYPPEDPFRPTFHPDRLDEPLNVHLPKKIFTVSMGDIFCNGVLRDWVSDVLNVIRACPWHTFQILTKAPQSIHAFVDELPPNLWLGVSAMKQQDADIRLSWLSDPTLREIGVKIKWVSFEPLHGPIVLPPVAVAELDWIVIGAETGNRKGKVEPDEDWIAEIVEMAEDFRIPVFMKDNLEPYWPGELKREFPNNGGMI